MSKAKRNNTTVYVDPFGFARAINWDKLDEMSNEELKYLADMFSGDKAKAEKGDENNA